jgi:hypothetical protein
MLFEAATIAKYVYAKLQFSSIYLDGLRQIFDHFPSKFQNFLRKIQIFPIKYRKIHLLQKFELSSIFTKNSQVI